MPHPVDGVCMCGLNKVMYTKPDGTPLCCDEGQVSNNGECADTCPAGMPFPVEGICSCGLEKVSYELPKGLVLCCDEGQLNDQGTCVDTCPPERPVTRIDGKCGCALSDDTYVLTGNPLTEGNLLCCAKNQIKNGEVCADCPNGQSANAEGVCGK